MRDPWRLWWVAGLLGACASTQQVEQLEAQLHQLEGRVPQSSTQDSPTATADDLDALTQRVAQLEVWADQSEEFSVDLRRALEEIQADLARIKQRAGDVGPGDFRKGQLAPTGLSALEIRQHATAQGDPHLGRFTLQEALAGAPSLADRTRGSLVATFETSKGRFDCVLHEDETPNTVANFVGLARGVRAHLDPTTDTWVRTPLYDGTIFHRVIAKFMIQGGDPAGTGKGGPGYVIEDEPRPSLRHEVGVLSMANRGKNTAGSQFFITVAKTPHLDDRHTVFGRCDPKVPKKISAVATDRRAGDRPIDPVKIRRVTIRRKKR